MKARKLAPPEDEVAAAGDHGRDDHDGEDLEETEVSPEVRKARRRAEEVARQALQRGDASEAAVLAALSAALIPLSGSRRNVLPEGRHSVQGMMCGLFIMGGLIGVSQSAKQNPHLTKLLAAFAQKEYPDFPFTSIQINKNYATRPHVDKNNLGVSLIIGLGEYEGGEVWVHTDDGEVEHEQAEDLACMYHYRQGTTYKGEDLDIRQKWTEFDGNRLHFTRPFTGERFSLVFFTLDRYDAAPPEVRRELRAAGFAFDWEAAGLKEALVAKLQDKQRLRRQLHEKRCRERCLERRLLREARGRCMARTWAQGWGGQCTSCRPEGGGDLCQGHLPRVWETHGRVDGPVPPKKLLEMLKWQRILHGKGQAPPDPLPLGAVVMVRPDGEVAPEVAMARALAATAEALAAMAAAAADEESGALAAPAAAPERGGEAAEASLPALAAAVDHEPARVEAAAAPAARRRKRPSPAAALVEAADGPHAEGAERSLPRQVRRPKGKVKRVEEEALPAKRKRSQVQQRHSFPMPRGGA